MIRLALLPAALLLASAVPAPADHGWMTGSGAVRPLTAASEPGACRVRWGTPATEQGGSRYALAEGGLTVVDSVDSAAGPRVFATHRLSRTD